MEFIDYYKILGLDKKATEADVKKAYRKLARKHHPDLNPNDTSAKQKFQQINEANEVLSDSTKRAKYDKYGKDWMHAEEFEKQRQQQEQYQKQYGQSSGRQRTTGSFEDSDFSDFFESMFGGGGFGGRQESGGRTTDPFNRRSSSQSKYRGQDFNAEVQLTLRDVFTTQKQTLSVNGKNIRITIPAGIENGQTIKITGHGGPGANGGPNGDLYIKFSITNDTPFKREGSDLYTEANLDIYNAILGGEMTLDTFDGKAKLKIKPGTQNETKVKLKGKGFPVYKKEGEFGDLYVTYKIKVPTNLTTKEIELFSQLSKLRKDGH
ncbi:MAG: J domain-containing protein [Saprospiraceae bacterium]